jgi:hypothetical protein
MEWAYARFFTALLLHSNMIVHGTISMQSKIKGCRSAALGQQQVAPIPDRDLRDFGKSLQQPGQCHFQPDMIVGHVEMTRRRLPQRADAKDHAITVPSFLVDFQHRDAGSGARQSRLEATGCFFTAEMMRNRNHERSGHLCNPNAIDVHVVAHRPKRKRSPNNGKEPVELSEFPFVFPADGSATVPTARLEERYMSIGTIILIILVIALLGGFSGIGGGPFYGTGYYGGGGLGLVIVILLILLLLGRL